MPICPKCNNSTTSIHFKEHGCCSKCKPKESKKKTIPQALRESVWRKYFFDKIDGVCPICKLTISITNFDCSHIIAESKGGLLHIDNLIPACKKCNTSMHVTDFNEFKKLFEKPTETKKDITLSYNVTGNLYQNSKSVYYEVFSNKYPNNNNNDDKYNDIIPLFNSVSKNYLEKNTEHLKNMLIISIKLGLIFHEFKYGKYLGYGYADERTFVINNIDKSLGELIKLLMINCKLIINKSIINSFYSLIIKEEPTLLSLDETIQIINPPF